MQKLIRVRLKLLLLLAVIPAFAEEPLRALTILHVNDLHARLLPDHDGQGGFAHLATAIRRERGSSSILLNAGDLVQGTPVSTIYRGLPVFEIVNLFGIDAFTLGNHEFDYGWKEIPRYIQTARFPIVTSNVVDAQGKLLTHQAYHIEKVNGIRVAVIGAVMGNLLTYLTPDRLGPWRALPVVETVRKYATEARRRADIVVLLGHLNASEEEEILREAPEIDVAVLGHEHRGLEKARELDGRVLVYVKGYGLELGRLDLQINVPAKKTASWAWKRIPIDARSIPPAKDVGKLVAIWEAKVAKTVDVPIGEARREISGGDLKLLVEQAMAAETGADLAFINRGGIRDTLPQGRLLARHVWNIMPFDDRVVIGRFRGSELPKAVAAGRAIDPHREYSLAVNEFSAINQKHILGTEGLTFSKIGPPLRDLLIDWIRKQKLL